MRGPLRVRAGATLETDDPESTDPDSVDFALRKIIPVPPQFGMLVPIEMRDVFRQMKLEKDVVGSKLGAIPLAVKQQAA